MIAAIDSQLAPISPGRRRGVSFATVLIAVAGVGLLLVLLLMLWAPGDSDNGREPAVKAVESSTIAAKSQAVASNPGDAELIDDDGHTLWASPTSGPALVLDYVPSATQMLLAVRPAEMLKLAEGQKLREVLAGAMPGGEEHLRELLGFDLADIDSLQWTLFPDASGTTQWAVVLRPLRPIQTTDMPGAWKNPRPVTYRGRQYYAGAQRSFYFPEESNSSTIVIASRETIEQLIELGGSAPLRNALALLVKSSDGSRHFHLLFTPHELTSDEPGAWTNELGELRGGLAWLLGDDANGVLLSGQLADGLFLELQAMPPVGRDPQQLARLIAERLRHAGPMLTQYLYSRPPEKYGREIIERLPAMLAAMSRYTRAGVEGRATIRAWLPEPAAHHLLLAASLLREPLAPGARSQPRAIKPVGGAAAALDQPITLSFPRETLERALELLSAQIEQPIVILGNDLQREGITRNQMLAIDETDSAGNVLLKVLLAANPAGKLTFVIGPGEEGRESIFITTRSAAAQRGASSPEN